MIVKQEIKLSIRNLVEFILRYGSIDTTSIGINNRQVEGTRIHRKIQKSSGEDYEAEVALKYRFEAEEFILNIEGRADGIIKGENRITIDEIKTTTAPLKLIDENFSLLHWAQAKCYAFIYSQNNSLDIIDIQLTYYHINTKEIIYLNKTVCKLELEEFFYDLIDKYIIWVKMNLDWNRKKVESIKALKFPFQSYRKGQRELGVAVYKTIIGGKKLFAHASTGIGKTISTIFPAIKAMGEGYTTKIFYLTAKTITRTVAEETFSKMRLQGLKLKTITLTAKDKICFKEQANCSAETCEYAKDHFDRVNGAIMDIFMNEDNFTRETIEKYASKHMVCPFEYSLDLTLFADSIICDYNYVFDPQVYLKRFFLDKSGDYVFLIDEAHNLIDRSREMFSAELNKKQFMQFKKILENKKTGLYKVISKINNSFIAMRKECVNESHYVQKELDVEFITLLRDFVSETEEHLIKHRSGESYEIISKLYFDCIAFLRISELYNEAYVRYIEKHSDDVRVKLFCVDPSSILNQIYKRGKSAILFSATLIPMDYCKGILGGDKDDYFIRLDSSFCERNRCVLIADDVSTTYRNRESSYFEIVEYIHSVISMKKGNYLIFFPSYKYMNEVYLKFKERYSEIKVIQQSTNMAEEEKEKYLEEFKENPLNNNLGFCVLGGIFSEGIDLKNDRLIGAIIIGVGLPQICLEREIIKTYFYEKNNLGYEFAYTYPGMNKVLQASGRVIRTDNDKGIILLIDERFASKKYQKLFPNEWTLYSKININNIGERINQFWGNNC